MKSKNIYFSLIIFLFLNIVLSIFLVYPIFRNIQKDSSELLSKKNESHSLLAMAEDLRIAESFYQEHQDDFEKMDNVFIDAQIPIDFINFLEGSAAEYQLSIEISSLNVLKDSSFLFQVSTSGSFENSMRFLEKLENGIYIIEIDNFSQRLSGDGRVNSNFSIKVFTRS